MQTVTPLKPFTNTDHDRPVVSPLSATLVLAYIQYYTPKLRPRGCLLAPKHLRRLSDWIGFPQPGARSLKLNHPLAAHLVLLHGAELLSLTGSRLALRPEATHWLYNRHAAQVDDLLAVAADETRWQQAAAGLRVEPSLDYRVFICQTLCRQQVLLPEPVAAAEWPDCGKEAAWRLSLPEALSLPLHFHLRQLGRWTLGGPLVCTPMSIAAAVERGYAPHAIQWLFEQATQQALDGARAAQLAAWSRRAGAYRLQPVALLSTNHYEALAGILRRKRFRPYVVEQLSPRHAVVLPEIAPQLSRWLAKEGFSLHTPLATDGSGVPQMGTAAYHWLGLRLLLGLGELIPLPYPPPHGLLAEAAQPLSPAEQVRLEQLAQQTLAGLQEAVRGRDAFFPARHAADPAHLALIEEALCKEKSVVIDYQALGDTTARAREVQPLRLEERGMLYYLYAYCYRAERNLTFRVDRIHKLEIRN